MFKLKIFDTTSPFCHQYVSDLYWILHQPALLSEEEARTEEPSDIEWLPCFLSLENARIPQQQILDHWQSTLSELNLNPSPLIDFIEQRNAKRVGFYFEALISFAIRHSMSLELVDEHIQLNHNKNTLGEIDFIIRDRLSNECIHLETAIKFYLKSDVWHDKDNRHKQWLGPMVKDRLDLKLDKLMHQQAQVSQHPNFKQCDKFETLPLINRKAVLMVGYLFHSTNQTDKPYWLTQQNMQERVKEAAQYRLATKPFWLSHPIDTTSPNNQSIDMGCTLNNQWLNKTDLMSEVQFIIKQWRRPVLVFQRALDDTRTSGENKPACDKRFFIVPDNWKGLSPPS